MSQACVRPAEHAPGRTTGVGPWLRTLTAQRRSQRDMARQTRDGITLRIGKPPTGPRPPIPTLIDLVAFTAHGTAYATAIIFVIGG